MANMVGTMSRMHATLSRDERRARARGRRQPTATPTANRCPFCLGPLANGAAVCSDECDEAYWKLVPTTDGELWEPPAPAA
jgi:hypothetical protein